MNKAILMGRLTRDPEIRYSEGENATAVARYTLAVDRRFRKRNEGEASADFIRCVAFGKSAEFAEKYFHQGIKIVVIGRIQTGSYTNRDGQKVYTTDIVVEEQEFAESKAASQQNGYSGSNGGYSGNSNGYSGNGGGYAGFGNAGGQQGMQGGQQSYHQQTFGTDRDGFIAVPDDVDDEELPFH